MEARRTTGTRWRERVAIAVLAALLAAGLWQGYGVLLTDVESQHAD